MNSNNGETVTFSERHCVVYQSASRKKQVRAPFLKLSPYSVVFRYSEAEEVLQMSQVLEGFQIVIDQQVIYSGRAVVSNMIRQGESLTCEASLENFHAQLATRVTDNHQPLEAELAAFLGSWEKEYRLDDACKLALADIQWFLANLRIWLDQVELKISAAPESEAPSREAEVIRVFREPILRTLTGLFDKFEAVARTIDESARALHRSYARQLLNLLLLESPFVNRTFYKPLGYAGDYEMVNMILRDPAEGKSLFAKLLNYWFLRHPPAEAHRNRIEMLYRKLMEEAVRVIRERREARILNLGCGSALEIQRFLQSHELSEKARFRLVDFSDETLQSAQSALDEIKRDCQRTTSIKYIKQSVTDLLKKRDSSGNGEGFEGETFDFVYCAGLFDYLADSVCKSLTDILYGWLAPGGLLLISNVDPSNPSRQTMEYFLDWNLIYRNAEQLRALKPGAANDEEVKVYSDYTGVNVFMEARKR